MGNGLGGWIEFCRPVQRLGYTIIVYMGYVIASEGFHLGRRVSHSYGVSNGLDCWEIVEAITNHHDLIDGESELLANAGNAGGLGDAWFCGRYECSPRSDG